MKNTSEIKNPSQQGSSIKNILVLSGILTALIGIYYLLRFAFKPEILVPINVIAFISGVLLEFWRLTRKWLYVWYMSLVSVVVSVFVFFIQMSQPNYNFKDMIRTIPYSFGGIFLIAAAVIKEKETLPKIGEGTVLLQSIAFLYWYYDKGLLTNPSGFWFYLMIIILAFTAYSLVLAFTRLKLTPNNRFVLSLWSSVLMIVLAIDHFAGLTSFGLIEDTIGLDEATFLYAQYFLLGISAIYIVRNYLVLISFLPGRGRFFNTEYFEDVKTARLDLIKRFSMHQLPINQAFVITPVLVLFYYGNMIFQWLPRNFAIWITLIGVPYVLRVTQFLAIRNQAVNRRK